MIIHCYRQIVLLAVVAAISGCTTGSQPAPAVDTEPAFADEYTIGIGDSLKVDVYRHADLSVEVPVRPDGKITVPVAGDVAVGGHTPEEVSRVVAQALAEYIRDPIVTTTVLGLGSNEFLTRVRVTGAVGKPVSMPFKNGMTVLDVVLEAGGVNEFANSSKTVLYRANGERISIRLDRVLKGSDMSTNVTVRPGDVVTVPERLF